jgi:hypothetical protein
MRCMQYHLLPQMNQHHTADKRSTGRCQYRLLLPRTWCTHWPPVAKTLRSHTPRKRSTGLDRRLLFQAHTESKTWPLLQMTCRRSMPCILSPETRPDRQTQQHISHMLYHLLPQMNQHHTADKRSTGRCQYRLLLPRTWCTHWPPVAKTLRSHTLRKRSTGLDRRLLFQAHTESKTWPLLQLHGQQCTDRTKSMDQNLGPLDQDRKQHMLLILPLSAIPLDKHCLPHHMALPDQNLGLCTQMDKPRMILLL